MFPTAPTIGSLRGLQPCWVLVPMLLAVACAGNGDSELSELALQGRGVYQNVCIACHHADPTQDGTLGPAVAGASAELLEAKVLHGEYPPGHTPKRPSLSMPVFDYLADDIPALVAYLAEVQR